MAASYGYYPEGGRAWIQVNGVTTLYLELDGVEWGSYDAAGTLKERTIRASGAGGAVVAVHSPAGGLIRLLPNRQGSVIGWLRPDGKLGGAYTFDAYGNSAQAGAAGPSFRYAGMRFDAETGLYHTPNRAYDPQDGRWMQLDPIGIKDGLNRYAYVKNSPLMGVDPTGLCGTGTRISGADSGQCRTAFDSKEGALKVSPFHGKNDIIATFQANNSTKESRTVDEYNENDICLPGHPGGTCGEVLIPLVNPFTYIRAFSGALIKAFRQDDLIADQIGVLRDAATKKGNYGLGQATVQDANSLGEAWVGPNYRIASDGRTLVSRDGLRTYRPPTAKDSPYATTGVQANFGRLEIVNGNPKVIGNGHLDIVP